MNNPLISTLTREYLQSSCLSRHTSNGSNRQAKLTLFAPTPKGTNYDQLLTDSQSFLNCQYTVVHGIFSRLETKVRKHLFQLALFHYQPRLSKQLTNVSPDPTITKTVKSQINISDNTKDTKSSSDINLKGSQKRESFC